MLSTRRVFIVIVILLAVIFSLASQDEISHFSALFDISVLQLGHQPATIQDFLASALVLKVLSLVIVCVVAYLYVGPPNVAGPSPIIVLLIVSSILTYLQHVINDNGYPLVPGGKTNIEAVLGQVQNIYIALSNQHFKDIGDDVNRVITLLSFPSVIKDLWMFRVPLLAPLVWVIIKLSKTR